MTVAGLLLFRASRTEEEAGSPGDTRSLGSSTRPLLFCHSEFGPWGIWSGRQNSPQKLVRWTEFPSFVHIEISPDLRNLVQAINTNDSYMIQSSKHLPQTGMIPNHVEDLFVLLGGRTRPCFKSQNSARFEIASSQPRLVPSDKAWPGLLW